MKINFDRELKNIRGETLFNERLIAGSDGANEKIVDVMRLKDPCVEALLAYFADEAGLTGEEKLKRWTLAKTIAAGGEIDLPVEEIALLKRVIAKAYPPLISGQVWEILEGKGE